MEGTDHPGTWFDRAEETGGAIAQGLSLDDEDRRVRAWRACQLQRLGLPWLVAQTFAPHVDWHEVAELVGRGCSPELALEIVR